MKREIRWSCYYWLKWITLVALVMFAIFGMAANVKACTAVSEDEAVAVVVDPADIKLIGQVVVAEALNQPDIGKIYVIDTILNRVTDERFPNTIEGVVKQPNQYVRSSGGVPDEILLLVQYEMVARTNNEVLYFRNQHYHTFGTPLFQQVIYLDK